MMHKDFRKVSEKHVLWENGVLNLLNPKYEL